MSEQLADRVELSAVKALREDLNAEHSAIVKVVSEFDGRLMIVKGWSVIPSLASLGLAFQQGHLRAVSARWRDRACILVYDAAMNAIRCSTILG
jgi:hypothetical protein